MNLYFRILYFLLVVKFRKKANASDNHPLETYEVAYRTWPSDLDIFMHMTNSKYFALMDLSRMSFLECSGLWRVISARGWYPVVAAQWMDYYRSLALFQKFTVQTKVMGWDDKFIYLSQDFISNGKKCASALVCARFLKKSGGGVDPDELIEAMGEKGVVSPELSPEVLAWRSQRG